MPSNNSTLEKRLWEAADNLRANSKLRASQYSLPVLGLIFLRFADHRFTLAERELAGQTGGRRRVDKTTYQARGVMFLPEKSRYSYLLTLPEDEDIGRAINEAMKAIEDENEDLRGVLPKQYTSFENDLLVSLLKTFNFPLEGTEGDVFGKIYEYFLGEFARTEGQKGGEFYTPTSLVKLIVEVIEPYHGRILDPACGSGGMFVQSADFVRRHNSNPSQQISIYGQEKETLSVRLAKMNLAVHGLSGIIREGNTYYEDIHRSVGKFDFVMANPPFNVDKVDKTKLKTDPRFPFGLPTVDNANYLWIQTFFSGLNDTGRAGFVMANSASDARSSELALRQKLIESHAVDVMIAIGSNFFYTVTLPCTLWFFDKGKQGTPREKTVLFIDARSIYRQVDRAHRDFSSEQLEFLANIVNLYRNESTESVDGSAALMAEHFPEGIYRDVSGLCKVASLEEIAAQGYSLNPGRYVGVAAKKDTEDFNFVAQLEALEEKLEMLNAEAHDLEQEITTNLQQLLRGSQL
jgi:type I restriction enzyme M protein